MDELFNAFGLDWRLLLIQAVNFGALLFILWRFLYRPVLRIIDERRAKIEEGVEKAREADARLAAAHEESESIVGKAAREAESMVAAARLRAEEKGSVVLSEAQKRADALLADAAARAEEAQRRALKESERDIAKAAMLAAEKVMREKSA
ncbi:ATP synthase F0 subunit B [Candidatus Kaiserbacteria bacterium CG10_big_fil_rev_8_21_14_0_10_59_10]|uniref:ATP synthase subunit b n=1 Tax=Candidatus Kaiserbacteria bacterium CG10_big_fil_rev_8_21_14_0_10_59_10 TaxID=1974612 RepID=A0A2H0U6S0_9BACT|nr:MAG: ATP synthase F0 subunit B [Candidatus Kaiserbacteria bacterium CG10_big_fil_rev_8_21_14_0_10_59_10]